MTNPEQLVNLTSEFIPNEQSVSSQIPQSFPETTEVKRGGGTLRQRLLFTVVPTTLIPLIVISIIGINITHYRIEKETLTQLEKTAIISREVTEQFFQDTSNIKNELENNSSIITSTVGLENRLEASLGITIENSEVMQIIDGQTGKILNTLISKNLSQSEQEIIGGETVQQIAQILTQTLPQENLQDAMLKIKDLNGISNLELQNSEKKPDIKLLIFESQGRYFKITPIPDTNLIVSVSIDKSELTQAGSELIVIFATIAIFLGFLAVGNIILLAQILSQPLVNLTDKAQQVASGDLDVRAELQGTEENRTLAYNFNTLVQRVKELITEQKEIANQQREEKEKLEEGIYQLLDELQYAVDGDLTVRASLNSMEMSTVADLCNAILDNLQDIAVQVKKSSVQVSLSLEENEKSIELLAQETSKEADETRKTLNSVQEMSFSIEQVATNANQAASLADDAYIVTQAGSKAMDETVDSILNLRSKVGDTAKKMKRLGESSQNISQVVSLIEEIALKTNLLAINASVEASRAGEQGQGFTVVAEQVGALAEQSAAATKQIVQLVAEIQRETQEVTTAMESGTSEVVNTTRLVESTKQRLEQVLERSRQINELMQNISQSTVSQTQTSRLVTELMERIAQQSEKRLTSSKEIAQLIKETAQVAQEMESAVEQFKVS